MQASKIATDSEKQAWAREIHRLFEREPRELKTSEVAEALCWPHSTAQRRLKALTASIEMVSHGAGTKSVRWRPLRWK